MSCRTPTWWCPLVCVCPGHGAGASGSPSSSSLQAAVWALRGGRPENWRRALSPLQATGLHFRHTDNINLWLSAIAHVGLPPVTPGPGQGSARPRTSPPTLAALTPSRGPFALIAVSSDSVCGFRFLGAVLSSPRFPGGKSGWRLLP